MGRGTLKSFDEDLHELLTEELDEESWWLVIRFIITLLKTKLVNNVRVEYGWILDRELDGKPQGQDRTIKLEALEALIGEGLRDGIIERVGESDFVVRTEDDNFIFMLCNDTDIHFASKEPSLAFELGKTIKSLGIKVYDNGKLI